MDSDATHRSQLAANIRRLRIAHRMSLSQLARQTAISKATLSGIESANGNPTFETLSALAAALGVELSELVASPPPAEIEIVRAPASRAWPPTEPHELCLREFGSLRGHQELVELALPRLHAHVPPVRSGGSRDAVLVRQGTLIAGPVENISELGTGDFACFPADVPHVYETTADPALVLLFRHLSQAEPPGAYALAERAWRVAL
jgi:transcriptional regulator with XRE-family HTH domain